MNAVREIQSFNAGRDPERLSMKYRAMRASPFAFLRGTCHLFYARLPHRGVFSSAPLAWVCGDLHLENFGSYKGDNRLVYFDINDFDEAVLARACWDVVRLLASLHIVSGALGVSDAKAEVLCRVFVEAYAAVLTLGKAYWLERDTAQGPVRELLDGLRERRRATFLNARTTLKRGRRQLLIDGERALPATAALREAVVDFMRAFAKGQPQPGFYSVLDVARRVAGTGSLGIDRFSILVKGKGSPDGNYVLDLKQALPSSLLRNLDAPQPNWATEAHRIVGVQRRMQAMPMALLKPVLFDARPFVLRALQPSEDRLALKASRLAVEDLERVAPTLAQLVAWAQLRSSGREGSASADELMEFGRRRKWQGRVLEASRECALQVPRDAQEFNRAWDDGAFGN